MPATSIAATHSSGSGFYKAKPNGDAGAQPFGFVTRSDMTTPRRAPIGSPISDPAKVRVTSEMLQRPSRIVCPVSREAQLRTRLHHPRQFIQKLTLDQPPLVVARLRPRIRKKDVDQIQRRIRQPRDDIAR